MTAVPDTGPTKPPHGQACTRCGICCLATPCDFAMNYVAGAEDRKPCPALEWGDGGVAACGLVIDPDRHAPALRTVQPLLVVLYGIPQRPTLGEWVRACLGQGQCDAGGLVTNADVDSGMTAGEWTRLGGVKASEARAISWLHEQGVPRRAYRICKDGGLEVRADWVARLGLLTDERS